MVELTLKHLVVAAAALAVALSASAERISECDFQASVHSPDVVDIRCNCMQRLRRMDLSIGQLTIDQRACPEKGLELNWPVLETLVAPTSIVLEGAHVFFARHSPDRQWNSSIVSLEFHECLFGTPPSYAFTGLKLLETIRISQSSIDVIQTGTFSNLNELRLIEITNSSVEEIQERSFTNLPALEDLAFTYTNFGEISSEAVVLPRHSSGDEARCNNLGQICIIQRGHPSWNHRSPAAIHR
ncbi:uncharacterized protein LOC125032098 [Penaeus chinensis]|uniref:uncharacterized protein LOC125032098 n=1 Tax=Penaeus chinensis TaxID=139456 RepID=UPI001FB77867|nr:uncharacterized protein LOC125032098 [Penaeus chinensis]